MHFTAHTVFIMTANDIINYETLDCGDWLIYGQLHIYSPPMCETRNFVWIKNRVGFR